MAGTSADIHRWRGLAWYGARLEIKLIAKDLEAVLATQTASLALFPNGSPRCVTGSRQRR